MKLFFRAFIIMASLGVSLHAEAFPDVQTEDYDFLANINPDDIPDVEETELSKNVKLQLFWEYLKLQTELAKIHVLTHKKAYSVATILVIGSIITYKTRKKPKS